jgi:PAS domain S-box-containing protein
MKLGSGIAVSLAMLTSGVVLLGWLADVERLAHPFGGTADMKVNAALSLVLAAVAFALIVWRRASRAARVAGRACAAAVVAIAAATLLEAILDRDFGIDQLLADAAAGIDGSAPGRMAPQTAVSLLLVGLALLVLQPSAGPRRPARALALAAAIPPALALIGYASATTSLYHVPEQAEMALNTVVALLLVCAAISVVRPLEGSVRLIALDSSGGEVARRLIPAVICLPIALTMGRRLAEEQGWVGTEVGVWLTVSAIVAVLTPLAWRTANRIEEIDGRRRGAEEALRAERDRVSAVLEAQQDGVALVSRDGELLEANSALCRMTGFAREELVGLREPFPFELEELADRLYEHRERVMSGVAGEADVVLQRRDGGQFPVIVASAPLWDERGCVAARVSTVKDVTVRRQAEEARRRLASIVEQSNDAIIAYGLDGCISAWNQAAERLYGYSEREALGMPAHQLMPEEAGAGPKTVLARILEIDSAVTFETTRVRKDGTRVAVAVTNSPMIDSEGNIVGISAIVRNISERKRAEAEQRRLHRELADHAEELGRSNAELEQFAYVASHDLAEPLRSIAGFVQLLERRYKGQLDDDADRFIGFTVDGVNRMQTLISDLLAYSRAGRRELEPGPVALEQLVAQVLSSLGPVIEENNGEVVVDGLPIVHADATQIGQVIQNLLANALKFHAPGARPRIQVSAHPADEGWHISVADNGIGIDPAYEDRIFKMFQRLHGRQEYPGTGIGLAICKRIVERHGGRIWFEPRSGGGTVFHFTLAGPLGAGDADHELEAAR